MPKPKKGDLVHLYRRKVGGAGLLLKRIPNVEEKYGISLNEIVIHKKDFLELPWNEKNRASIKFLYPKLTADQVLEIMSIIGVVESYCSQWDKETNQRELKPKYHTDFAKVKWLKAPGEYSDEPARYYNKGESWFPTSWLKVLK